jgi:propanol-preferring alcohol dehydrogenase
MVLEQVAAVDSSPLRLCETATPEPGEGQLRVKVRCCAVCRTDLHVVEGDLPRAKMPVIPGHQVIGAVDELGPGCGGNWEVGMRAGIAWLRWACGRCEFCGSQRENLCGETRFTGYHADGGYAEYALVPEEFAYEIPPSLSDVQAAPLLCAGIIGYRALKRARLPRGGKLAMYGFGSSAHVLLPLVRHRGGEVYVVTRDEKHRQLARKLGAVWVGDNAAQMPVKVDSAILFAPVGELVLPALAALKRGGTLALAGIYMTPIPQMDYERYLFQERDIRSVTCNTREDGRELLAEAAEIAIQPHTALYPLAEANRALQDLKHDRISGTGVLIVDEKK